MEEVQYNQKEEENFQEFSNNIRKVRGPRKHKIKGSYGIYDGFKYYRKIKPKNSEYVLTESQYFHITRRINRILGDKLLEGEDITFPYRLGRLEIRKEEAKIVIKDEKSRLIYPLIGTGLSSSGMKTRNPIKIKHSLKQRRKKYIESTIIGM